MTIAEQILQAKTDIDDVYTKGVADGKAQGGDTEEAYQNGYTDGKEAEYDTIWNAIQDNGKRVNYYGAFGYSYYKQGDFKPKYPIKPTSANRMFVATTIEQSDNEYLEIDLSNCTDVYWMFRNTKVKKIGKCDLRNLTALSLEGTFSILPQTTEIKEIVSKRSLVFSNTFVSSSALENVIFSGEIGNNLDLSSCKKLTHDSLMSVINCLIEIDNKTLKLGETNLAKLTDEEKAIATEKGWTLA